MEQDYQYIYKKMLFIGIPTTKGPTKAEEKAKRNVNITAAKLDVKSIITSKSNVSEKKAVRESPNSIGLEKLKRIIKSVGERFSDEEISEMFEEADKDGDGEINNEDFTRLMKNLTIWSK